MQPNDSPTPPTPTPTPPPQPLPLSPPQMSVPTQPPISSQSQTTKRNNVTLLIVGVIALLLGLLAILGILVYVFYLSPAAQSRAASNKFMGYLTKGDINNALTLTISNDQDTRTFLENASAKLRGEYTLSRSADKNSKYYFLYELSGSEYNAARTQLIKENGRWVVEGLFYNNGNLALIPGDSSEQNVSNSIPEVSTTSCLVQSDFDEWYKNGTGIGKTATEYGFDFSDPNQAYSTNVKFEADSLNYTQPQVNQSFIQDIADLAKAVNGKEYTIRLYGSVATTSPADLEFATKRANKVKDDLVALGVPGSKISVENSTNIEAISDPEFRDNVTKAGARGVHIKFDPTCSGGQNSSNGR